LRGLERSIDEEARDESHSNAHAVIANVLRCCLHISSASFGSVVCACAGREALSSSSYWRQSRKTSAGSQSSSSAHRRSQRSALCGGRVRWQRSQTVPCQGWLLQEDAPTATRVSPPTFWNKICQKQTFCAAVRNVVIRSPHRRAALGQEAKWIVCSIVSLNRLAVDFENFGRSTRRSVIKDADCQSPRVALRAGWSSTTSIRLLILAPPVARR
jgi:hypothetical protein